MHLKHLLTTTLLALLSGSVASQGLGLPDLNTGSLGLRDIPQNMGSQNMGSKPKEGEAPSSSSEYQSPSSSSSWMGSNSPTSNMATTATPSTGSMTPSSTQSTLQSSMRSNSGIGRISPSSRAAYASSSPASSSGSNNMLGGLLGDKGLHLRAEPTQAEGALPGYMQPAYQPAVRPT